MANTILGRFLLGKNGGVVRPSRIISEEGAIYKKPLTIKVDLTRGVRIGMASGGVGELADDNKDQRYSLCKWVALGVKPMSWAILGSRFPLEVLSTPLSRCVGAKRSI